VTAAKAAQPAPAEFHTGIMVAAHIPPAAGRRIAVPGGLPLDDLHLTLVYLGDVTGRAAGDQQAVADAVTQAVGQFGPLTGTLSGVGRFTAPGDDNPGDPVYAAADVPGLGRLRLAVADACAAAGVPPASNHDFTPHVTLAYIDPGDDLPVQRLDPVPIGIGELVLSWGEDDTVIPLPGAAAGRKITPGAYVTLGARRGRVDRVVGAGEVPGLAGATVAGTPALPAARVVLYGRAGAGWAPTGVRVAAPVGDLALAAPLPLAGAKGLLDVAATVDECHTAGLDVTSTAVKAVYGRGVSAWPGPDVTALSRQEWAADRVGAYLELAAGRARSGYVRDRDLLP
jgi:2'-5' RNA ligase